jgi:predicted N-formylglutamate amidohydrolase
MTGLLAPDEGPAVEIRTGSGPFVLVCEHAANRLPRALGDLGLSEADRQRHIAWDLGAADLTAGIAERLSATTVMQRFSRLVVDCNRDPGDVDAFIPYSEHTEIPGNVDLSAEAKAERIAAIWQPFHAAVERLLDLRRTARRTTALVTVHSFTPVYRGVSRPWHVGIISTTSRQLSEGLLRALRADRTLVVGDNEPYSAKDNVDYTIRRHGRDRNLLHAMIEVRNDLLATPEQRAEWVERLSIALGSLDVSARAA